MRGIAGRAARAGEGVDYLGALALNLSMSAACVLCARKREWQRKSKQLLWEVTGCFLLLLLLLLLFPLLCRFIFALDFALRRRRRRRRFYCQKNNLCSTKSLETRTPRTLKFNERRKKQLRHNGSSLALTLQNQPKQTQPSERFIEIEITNETERQSVCPFNMRICV